MAINGLDDRLHPPTRLFLLVTVRRHETQRTADSLPVKFQHVSRAKRGNQFHIHLHLWSLSLCKFLALAVGRASVTSALAGPFQGPRRAPSWYDAGDA